MSVLFDILEAVQANVEALELTLSSAPTTPITVDIGKLPKREEVIDGLPKISITGAVDLDSRRPFSFGDKWFIEYIVEITLMAPNNRDNATNLEDYTDWRYEVQNRFRKPPLSGGPAVVYDLDVLDGDFLDREILNQGYDYQQVVVKVTTIESGA